MTGDGKYSAATAYDRQFLGAYSPFPDIDLWKAFAERKSKFFAWLVLHNRVLIADNMAKRNWDCNPQCSLCFCSNETTDHLLAQCNFAEAMWS
jgi:hypothetical protein